MILLNLSKKLDYRRIQQEKATQFDRVMDFLDNPDLFLCKSNAEREQEKMLIEVIRKLPKELDRDLREI